ncbi:MAG: mycofactocin biosynthesis glycosyltransferase MftF, partial [Deltaproteobacteria bacterium]|nr:mycofactocin biosynthesis glycosyltransferase MftF [Candidatus Anaeroferrophillacea bacterium]
MVGESARRIEPLSWRLSPRASRLTGMGGVRLLVDYPLKSIALHPAWTAVVEQLNGSEFVPLAEIVPLIEGVSPEQVKLFLQRLSRNGFLEQAGVGIPVAYPFVSVIIPVRNRPEQIAACLDSLGELDYPPELHEVIVVDDASTDETPRVVADYPVTLHVLAENRQAAYCRNYAAARAKGDVLAFIDSDCLAHPLWLRELVPAFDDPTIVAVGGVVGSFYVDTALDRYEEVKSSLIVARQTRRSSVRENFFYVPSCNLLVRDGAFGQVGGFRDDMHVGEDVDLCWRLHDAGRQVEFRPQGVVYHKHRNETWPFCRRRFDYGTSEPMLQRRHPERSKRMFFPPGAMLFWGAVVLTAVTGVFTFLLVAGIVLAVDVVRRFYHLSTSGVPVGITLLSRSVGRSYFAFMYHVCAFFSRYYLIMLPLILLV